METTIKNNKTSRLIKLFQEIQVELEDFQVQLSLGKMEARDLYIQLQDEYKQFIREFKEKLHQAKNIKNERLEEINNKIDELEVLVKESKEDDTKEKVLTRLQQLKTSAGNLQLLLKDKTGFNEAAASVSYQLQKLAIKLTMLTLFYKLGKVEWKHKWTEQKREFDKKMEKLESSIAKKKEAASEWWTHFKDEVEEAFEHLEKAIRQ